MSHHYYKRKRFQPETTVFHNSSKILPALLEDIVKCYQKGRKVCKYCYYRKGQTRSVIKTKDGPFCNGCSQRCLSVWLMPASRFCENFDNMRDVPIPPMPKWPLEKADKPFGICTRRNHRTCFEMSATSDIWFAHTIEELAVWTIEKEHGCTFQQYIDQYYYGNYRPQSHKSGSSSRVGRPLTIKDQDMFDWYSDSDDSDGEIDPSEVMFDDATDIPLELLEDVMDKYTQAENGCRYCFYYEREVSTSKDGMSRCKLCKKKWSSIKIIPASRLCRNFGNFQKVPIDKPSNHVNPGSPHQYCMKSDHYRCFESYAETGFKFAHSVEELVVWTIEREKVGYGNFRKFIKNKEILLNDSGMAATVTEPSSLPVKYVPGGDLFPTIMSIPPELLSSVCECYERRLNTCRACFFDSIDDKRYNAHPTLSSKEEGSNMCERGHYWKPIRVIPSSDLCEAYGRYLAIPPVPRHMNKSKTPFQLCNFGDHGICFEKTRETNPWFPHTVEETVIWTVERETGRDFSMVFKDYIIRKTSKKTVSPPLTNTVPREPEPERTLVAEMGTQEEEEEGGPRPRHQSKDLSVAIESLVEGVQGLVSNHSPVLGNGGHVFNEGGSTRQPPTSSLSDNQNSPLLFVDDESDGESPGVDNLPGAQNHEERESQKREMTLSEATIYFPALAKPGRVAQTTDDLPPPSSVVEVNPFLTQVPATGYAVPRPLPHPSLTTVPIIQPLPPSLPSLPKFNPSSQVLEGSIKKEFGMIWNEMDEEEDYCLYECYLCYREFMSAKDLARHSTKQTHVEIMKKDFTSDRVWKYYPPPPDQGPEDFGICNRPSGCPGRLRCCSAHSLEERDEWMFRYRQRNKPKQTLTDTPMEMVAMSRGGGGHGVVLSTDEESSQYKAMRLKVRPSVQQHTTVSLSSKKPLVWKLTVTGQGWQTLIGVECSPAVHSEVLTPSQFEVSAIKGDTIYTLRPRNAIWVAPMFEDGILLGCIMLVIKATSLPVGSHNFHVKLHIGQQRYIYAVLQASVLSEEN